MTQRRRSTYQTTFKISGLVAAALLPSSKAFHHFGTVPKGSREDAGSTHEWQVL